MKMSYENTKMVITGGMASRVYFDELCELAGTDQPKIIIDMSPRVTQSQYDTTRQMFTEGFERLKLPSPLWMQDSITDPLTADKVVSAMDEADSLLVSGGATKYAYEKWQAAGVTELIHERVREGGIVAAGGSAGAMIWFAQGYTDSMQYVVDEGEHWDYGVTEASGFFPSWATAHYTDIDSFGRDRSLGFATFLAEHDGAWERAIGIDTGAALVCKGGIARIKDVTMPQRRENTDVYLFSSGMAEPTKLSSGDTIPMDGF
jgi:cyanophycinase-like exopeptidase